MKAILGDLAACLNVMWDLVSGDPEYPAKSYTFEIYDIQGMNEPEVNQVIPASVLEAPWVVSGQATRTWDPFAHSFCYLGGDAAWQKMGSTWHISEIGRIAVANEPGNSVIPFEIVEVA